MIYFTPFCFLLEPAGNFPVAASARWRTHIAREMHTAGVRLLAAALLVAAAAALHPVLGPRAGASLRPALAVPASRRARIALAAEGDEGQPGPAGGGSETATEPLPPATTLQEKRLRAQRLALKAERASLEAEQLELQAEQLRLATALKRGTPLKEKAPSRPPSPPSPPAAPKSLAASGEAVAADRKSTPDAAKANETSQPSPFAGLRFPSPSGLNDTSLSEPPVAGTLASALRSMGGGKDVKAEDLQLTESQVRTGTTLLFWLRWAGVVLFSSHLVSPLPPSVLCPPAPLARDLQLTEPQMRAHHAILVCA
jgi:hypothetical protein